jgi:hypothetical protein
MTTLPDLSRFDDVEVMPVWQDPDTGFCEPVPDAPHTATFWTVYGHLRSGGTEDLIDCVDERSAEFAAHILLAALNGPASSLLSAASEAASVLRERKAIAFDRCARALEEAMADCPRG